MRRRKQSKNKNLEKHYSVENKFPIKLFSMCLHFKEGGKFIRLC